MTLRSNQTEKDLILLGLGIINGMIRNDTITIPMLKNTMDSHAWKITSLGLPAASILVF
jgi:hypothetical protein